MKLLKLSKKGCAPCVSLSKFLSENYPEVEIEEVDVETVEGSKFLGSLGYSSVPVLTWNGLVCSGFSPAKVRKFVEDIKEMGTRE